MDTKKIEQARIAKAFLGLWKTIKPISISIDNNIRHKVGLVPSNVIFLPSHYDKVFGDFWKEHNLKGKVFKITKHGGAILYKFCNFGDPASMLSFVERHKYAKKQISLGVVREALKEQREKYGHSLCDPNQLDEGKQYFICSYVKGYTYPYAQLVGKRKRQEHLIASTHPENGRNVIFLDEENLFKTTPRSDDRIKSLLAKSTPIADLGWTNIYAVDEF